MCLTSDMLAGSFLSRRSKEKKKKYTASKIDSMFSFSLSFFPTLSVEKKPRIHLIIKGGRRRRKRIFECIHI